MGLASECHCHWYHISSLSYSSGSWWWGCLYFTGAVTKVSQPPVSNYASRSQFCFFRCSSNAILTWSYFASKYAVLMATYVLNSATTHHSEFVFSKLQTTCRYFPLFTGHAWTSFNSMMQCRTHYNNYCSFTTTFEKYNVQIVQPYHKTVLHSHPKLLFFFFNSKFHTPFYNNYIRHE